MTTNSTPSVSTLRLRAMQQGKRLVKISERSKWYAQYGPFMLTENNLIHDYGMTAEDVATALLTL